MNLVNKLKKRKMDNKGFSLVELIIVIAIMAILVGIVGTQVLPYLERSKESKDLQIVNSYSTAATTAYSSNAGKISKTSGTITVEVYTGTYTAGTDEEIIQSSIKTLTGYSALSDLIGAPAAAGVAATTGKFTSKTALGATDIKIVIDIDNKKITTEAVGTTLDKVNADL